MVWCGACRDSWRNWRNRRNRPVGLDVPAIAQSERADDGKRVSKLARVAADQVSLPPRRTVSAECAAPSNGASSFRTTAMGMLASKRRQRAFVGEGLAESTFLQQRQDFYGDSASKIDATVG